MFAQILRSKCLYLKKISKVMDKVVQRKSVMKMRTATATAICENEGNMPLKADILTFKTVESKMETVTVNNSMVYRFIKRTSDIILSLLALIILSPVFLVTAIAIKMEDGEPVIFTQDRSGLNGKVFKMYKFRSMVKNAPELHKQLLEKNELDGPAFKMKDDPRITKVGKVIRRTSIDELPQLINILKGEMSIVGPRPLPVYETEELDAYQQQRLNVKPGLTCYWQVNGRNDIGFDEWMDLDMRYIREASVWTDVKLIFMTFRAVFSGEGAV